MTEAQEVAHPDPGRARLTPYELVFTEGEFESRTFPRIRREAVEQAVDAAEPERFDFLSTAGEVLRQLVPEESPPDALDQYRALLYHAYHFWAAGRPLYTVEPAVARYLVESAPRLQGWAFRPPADACYLQLPANLFWSSIAPDTPPEPVDGFFLTSSETVGPQGVAFRTLELLVVLGIRRSRAGFSIIPLRMQLEGEISDWWEEAERTGGDFENVLPGGELSGLYSMLTTGEVFKLVAWICWYIDSFPESLRDIAAAEPGGDAQEPPVSRLAYRQLTLEGAGAGPDLDGNA